MSRRPTLNLLAPAVVILASGVLAWFLSRNPLAATHDANHQNPASSSNVIARVTDERLGQVAELSEEGYWLSVHRVAGLGGWGHRLNDPQRSLFVTNGLLITEPDLLAFDLEEGRARNIVNDFKPTKVAWGETAGRLAVGLKVRNGTSKRGETVRLEMYLRNESGKPLRVFACPEEPNYLFRSGLRIADPGGTEVSSKKGELRASYAICSHHSNEADWPTLQPGETLGPINLDMLTSSQRAYVRDIWFNCSKSGQYQVKIDYEGPAALHNSNAVAKFAPVWQGKATSGTVLLNRN